MGMGFIIPTLTQCSGLFLLETILNGGGRGGAHKAHGLGKSMHHVESYLVWEGDLHGDSLGKIASIAVKG